MKFQAIVIGDEIMSGRREDKHMRKVIEVLGARGMKLFSCEFIGDDSDLIVETLKRTMQSGSTVFCFGGLGATPDDLTRAAAACAAGVQLARHPEAEALITGRFGGDAYPHRIKMADLPEGSTIIPNPVNQVPGFSLGKHHFFPGFPEMAWPMLEWILEREVSGNPAPDIEMAILIEKASEGKLMDLMLQFVTDYPELKLFSLPKLAAPDPSVELGFRGPAQQVRQAIERLGSQVTGLGFDWKATPPR